MPKMPQVWLDDVKNPVIIVRCDRKDKGRVLVEHINGERFWTLRDHLTLFVCPRELVLKRRKK